MTISGGYYRSASGQPTTINGRSANFFVYDVNGKGRGVTAKSSDKVGGDLEKLDQWFEYASYVEAALVMGQSFSGNGGKKLLNGTTSFFGKVGYVASGVKTFGDVRNYSRGDVGVGRLSFRLTGTGVELAIGYLGGPVGGVMASLTFEAGEQAFDKVSKDLKTGYNNFINNLIHGWQLSR